MKSTYKVLREGILASSICCLSTCAEPVTDDSRNHKDAVAGTLPISKTGTPPGNATESAAGTGATTVTPVGNANNREQDLSNADTRKMFETWYTPNLHTSDYAQLFSQPEKWAGTRSKVDVFKFHGGNLNVGDPAVRGNDFNKFASVDAFRKLRSWNIKMAFETGVFKAIQQEGLFCKESVFANGAVGTIRRVADSGGDVAYIALDEPLYALRPENCNLDFNTATEKTMNFVKTVNAAYPNLEFVLIEAYPADSVDRIISWIEALIGKGFKMRSFHLDIDRIMDIRSEKFRHDMRKLNDFLVAKKIRFGIIFWGGRDSDQAYFRDVLEFVRDIRFIGRLPDVQFQNWNSIQDKNNPYFGQNVIPRNLPENDPNVFSHTRLIFEGVALLLGGYYRTQDGAMYNHNGENAYCALTSVSHWADIAGRSVSDLTLLEPEVRTIVNTNRLPGHFDGPCQAPK
jgi:hypothetical protein